MSRMSPFGVVTIMLSAPVFAQGADYRLHSVSPLTLQYTIMYASCFESGSEYARAILRDQGATADQLPKVCRERRKHIEGLAATKLKSQPIRAREAELRQMKKNFDIVERQYPLPVEAQENGSSNA